MHFRTLLTACVVLGSACGGAGSGSGGGRAEFTAEWIGADTGGLSVRPSGVWCERDSALKVTAVKGDLGVGVVIYPIGQLKTGHYPVFDPGLDSMKRPGAAFAVRWVDDKHVAAYQSDSGGIDFSTGSTGLSGKFTVRMRGLDNTDTVRMTGHFGGFEQVPCADSVIRTPSR